MVRTCQPFGNMLLGLVPALLVHAAALAQSAGTVSLVPVRATGGYMLAGNEIILSGGGQGVFLDAYLSGWDPDGDSNPALRGYQLKVRGTYGSDESPGVLKPVVVACTPGGVGHAECEAVFGPGSRCEFNPVIGDPPYICANLYLDRLRSDWIMAPCEPDVIAVSDLSGTQRLAALTTDLSCVIPDSRGRVYAGTIVLDVPPDVIGTYMVSLVSPAETFFFDNSIPAPVVYEFAVLEPALITVASTSRYASCWAGATGGAARASGRQAIRVRLTSLHHPDPPYAVAYPGDDFSTFEGQVRWVGSPAEYPENQTPTPTFFAAPLQCEPYFMDWSAMPIFSMYGAEMVPSSVYTIDAFDEACGDYDNPACYSAPWMIKTGRWGDVVPPFASLNGPTQPDFLDIAGTVDKFKDVVGAPRKSRAQLQPNVADPSVPVNFADITAAVEAFRGAGYPFPGPTPCP